MPRKLGHLIVAGSLAIAAPSWACTLTSQQKIAIRDAACTPGEYQRFGLQAGPGCTARIMELRLVDSFTQIALARRCGFDQQADTLERALRAQFPLLAKVNACIDQPMEFAPIEQRAKQKVEELFARLQGCPIRLRKKVKKRLPELLALAERSIEEGRKTRSLYGLGSPPAPGKTRGQPSADTTTPGLKPGKH